MLFDKDESSCRTDQAIDIVSAVKGLHALSSQDLGKLIKDSESSIITFTTENGSSIQIDVENLARFLPLHLIAMLISSKRDEALLKHLLCGFRLLHSLCDLASRQPRLEQILLDDVRVSEQILDLIFYLLIVLGGYRQELHTSSNIAPLHSALVTCSLYLLTGCISSQWQELAQVLPAHPKVNIFIDAAFGAVCVDIELLGMMLSAQDIESCAKPSQNSDEILEHLCQHCEASLQFLLSLCQQKVFREHLVKNKELCGKGGILVMAELVMKLGIIYLAKQSSVIAAISRMKSKVLSILLHLCEAESLSFLDVVASTSRGLDLAKTVAFEILEVLKTMIGRDLNELKSSFDKTYPRGLLQLNALRLADIFSDDSIFRSYITVHSTGILTEIFSLAPGEFLSCWCSSNLPVWEEDATLDYDPFCSSGRVLDLCTSPDVVRNLEPVLIACIIPRASYAHQRTSLLVKVIANLHCFAPDICKEEKDTFLNKFLQCLQKENPKLSDGFSLIYDAEKAALVSKNLRALLSHAESLIPSFLIEEDVHLLRVFKRQLLPLITPRESNINRVQERKFEDSISWEKTAKLETREFNQEAQSAVDGSSPLRRTPHLINKNVDLKEGMSENSTAFQEADPYLVRRKNVNQTVDGDDDDDGDDKRRMNNGKNVEKLINIETSGSDSSCTRGKFVDPMDCGEYRKSNENVGESGFTQRIQGVEKQRRKRKRTIMNDNQVMLVEKALLDEPDMQRHANSLALWAQKLSEHGSEVTTSQLKNWLNNRKARLARVAKEGRPDNNSSNINIYNNNNNSYNYPPEKRLALYDSPESPVEDGVKNKSSDANAPIKCGCVVMLMNGTGVEVGKGVVCQAEGMYHGLNLGESKKCVVDVVDDTDGGREVRLLWDTHRLIRIQPL